MPSPTGERRPKRLGTAALIGLCLLAGGWATAPRDRRAGATAGEPQREFTRLSDEYLSWYFRTHPVRATRLGVHRYDSALPDLSREAIASRIADSRAWLDRLHAIDPAALSRDARFDHRILDHAIRAELLELEEIRGWRHNPLVYSRLIADAFATLVEDRGTTLEQRLPPLTDRVEQLDGLLDAARSNLEHAPGLWIDLAAQGVRGIASFMETELDEQLEAQGLSRVDPGRRLRWDRARRRAVAQLNDFGAWLEGELRASAGGEFRLGRELFERKLWYEEHVALSADELRRLNREQIDRYRLWLTRVARRIGPRDTPEQVMDRITTDHPPPDELLRAAATVIDEIHRFVTDRDLVGLPESELPEVRATPPWARSSFASMSAPGPFEDGGSPAFYNVTNVDPSWTERQQAEHLTYFNFPSLVGIAIHEVMPGHFVQLSWRRRLPTDVRKVFLPASVVEGWAHYVEQMVVDEGLGDEDPAVRLAQLRRALQRHARWDAGLEMHAYGLSIDEAVTRFREIAYFAEFPAQREIQRGTYDPTYLYYALGRMQILALREDYRRYLVRRGRPFSLREFHDRFLELGLPISLAREALMPDDDQLSHSGSASTPNPSAKRS
ncbi:MAG TPA: DUF885 domain-containing protein [Candidatus Polarisedimenticolaceae bacterium]|nr:DUF885 domain-containing protein [Candidatus Polarisedimenticolaceae bacterium]